MKQDTKDSIDRYVKDRIPGGSFINAVLANDLMGAFGRADVDNSRDMKEICSYVYNEIPLSCHGSYEIVEKWLHPEAVVEE